jgi:hypothetical protein
MRVPAVMFGALATLGSGYVAAAAVESVRIAHPAASAHHAPAPAGEVLWYGGVLEPVIVPAQALHEELVTRVPVQVSCRRSAGRDAQHESE